MPMDVGDWLGLIFTGGLSGTVDPNVQEAIEGKGHTGVNAELAKQTDPSQDPLQAEISDPSTQNDISHVDDLKNQLGNTDPWQSFLQSHATQPGQNFSAYGGYNDQSRGYQNAQLQNLHNLAQGDDNSPSQQMLKDQFKQAKAQASSLGAAQKGRGAGAGARNVSANQAQLSGMQVGQSQALKLREQQQAQQQMLALLMQQHGQDINMATMTGQQDLGNANEVNRVWQNYMNSAQQNFVSGLNNAQSYMGARLGQNLNQQNINGQFGNSVVQAGAAGAGALDRALAGGNQQNNNQGFNPSPMGDYNTPQDVPQDFPQDDENTGVA